MTRWLTVAGVSLASIACGSKGTLAGRGGECNVVGDCESGLVCIPQKGGASICSNDLGSIQQLPPTPDAGGKIPTANDAGSPPQDTGAAPVTDAAVSGGD